MKRLRIHIALWSAAFLLQACGGEDNAVTKTKNAASGISEAVNAFKQVSKSPSMVEEALARIEELKLIAPASKEALKGWLPEGVDGFVRKSFSVGTQAMADISSITASFILEDENKRFELNVIDGAGEAGGVFTMVYMGQFNRDFEEERADGFSKSMNRGDKKAVVSQNNRTKTAQLEFLEGDRYYVKISGDNMDVDELWMVADGVKTSALPGL